MTQTITIKINNRPVTLTARDVQSLIQIARDIKLGVISWPDRPGFVSVEVKTRLMVSLRRWLDRHEPDTAEGDDQ